jgi:CPA2 family monovalent cation:H+ antiporter-2
VIARPAATHPLPSFHERVELTLLHLLAAEVGGVPQADVPPMLGFWRCGDRLRLALSSSAEGATPRQSACFLMFVIGLELACPSCDPARFRPGIAGCLTIVLATTGSLLLASMAPPCGACGCSHALWRCRARLRVGNTISSKKMLAERLGSLASTANASWAFCWIPGRRLVLIPAWVDPDKLLLALALAGLKATVLVGRLLNWRATRDAVADPGRAP